MNKLEEQPSCIQSIYSLKLLFSISVVLVIMTAVGTLATLSVGQARALENSVYKLIHSIEPSVTSNIQQLLDIPERASKSVVHTLQWKYSENSSDPDYYDYTVQSAQNYGIIRNYPAVATSLWAWRNGLLYGYHKESLFSQPAFMLQFPGSDQRLFYTLDDNGMGPNLNNISGIQVANVTDRVWWTEPAKKKAATWTSSFIGSSPPTVLVAYVVPIFDPSLPGEIMGVAVTSVATYTLSPLLQSLDLGPSGRAFIIENNGNLLATSSKLIRPVRRDENGNIVRVHSTSCGDYWVERVARRVLSNDKLHEVFTIRIRGQRYKVAYKLINQHNGLTWSQVVVLNYEDFATSTKRSLAVSLSISSVVVIISALFTILLSVIINFTFSRFSRELFIAANMHLEQVNISENNLSYISEIRQMQISFVWLVKNLMQYRTFLPPHILASLDNGDDVEYPSEENRASNKVFAADESHRSSSFSGKSSQITYNKLELGLVTKNIAVLNVRFDNFQYHFDRLSVNQIVEVHGEFIRRVFDVVTRNRGVIDRFVGDTVYASWNASKLVRNYSEKACNAALELDSMIKSFKIESISNPLEIDFHIVVATGCASLGNMGFQKLRSFGVIGDVVDRCTTMIDLCDEYKRSILIDSETFAAVRKWFWVKPLDTIILERRNTEQCHFDLYQLTKRKPAEQDNEWMYEMNNQQHTDSCKEILEIWELVKKGDTEEASVKAESYLKKNPDDATLKLFNALHTRTPFTATRVSKISLTHVLP